MRPNPRLVPLIGKEDGLTGLIDIFGGMGGVAGWRAKFPRRCTVDNSDAWPPCAWWCDEQSCDQCHPNNNGYAHLAEVLYRGLGIPPTPPPPPGPPSPPGVWVYQAAPTASGRSSQELKVTESA